MKTYIAAAALFAAGTICANAFAEADTSFFGDFYAENADFKFYGDTNLDEIHDKEWVSGCAGFSFTLNPVDDEGEPASDRYFSLGAITFAHGGFSGNGEVYLNVYTSPTPSKETFLGQSSEPAVKKPGSGKLAFESVNFRDGEASDIILETGQTYYVFFSSTLINGDYVFTSVDGTLVLSKSEDVRGDDVAYAGTDGSAAGDDGARPIYGVSLDAASLPEPSAFGLLAGTCALAFAASRRGRKS